MIVSTLLAERLKSAGVNTDAARLHELAVRMLRRSGGDPARAADMGADIVRADAGLLLALFGSALVGARWNDYLTQVAADMAGPAPGHIVPAKVPVVHGHMIPRRSNRMVTPRVTKRACTVSRQELQQSHGQAAPTP